MKGVIFILFFIAGSVGLHAQPLMESPKGVSQYREHTVMLSNARYINANGGAAKTTAGTGPIFDTAKWTHRIDSTWGVGMADTAKLNLFNQYWAQVDSYYACFVQLPSYNWDSIVNAMRTEISAGVSRGRFAGIAGNLMNYINDGHSWFYDYTVNYGSAIYPGKPVFRGESGLFGACITTLHDTEAMVYDANAGHPFGLRPGDVILGYNGIAWTTLVKLALQYQMPRTVYTGSSDEATYHRYIQAAGENWYLFDTINIRKCDGSLVSFPTSLMVGKKYSDFCTEQMPVDGVSRLSYNQYYVSDRSYSSGVIKGTRVGYVYMYDCSNSTGDSLYNAVKTLVEDSLVSGLILDIRTNFGGGFLAFYKTFKYLNEGDVSWTGYGDRYDPTLRLSLTNFPTSWYDVMDDDPHHFDKKIAILTGPGAVSAGDFLPVLFRHHPQVKTFGKSTAGAYGSTRTIPLSYTNYYGGRQNVNFYDVSDPFIYLTHLAVPVDSNIWFTKESVCNGVDNMVEAAVKWIEPSLGMANHANAKPSIKIYPNPSGGKFNMAVISPVSGSVTIRICNVLGATVKTSTADLTQGEQVVKIDFSDMHLPGGCYHVIMQGANMEPVVRKFAVY